jgi:hypothetical protein
MPKGPRGAKRPGVGPYLITAVVVVLIAAAMLGRMFSNMRDPWHGQGFGPGWECTSHGKSSATVCAKDAPSSAVHRRQPNSN